MAALVRLGLVRNWSAHARVLKRIADMFKTWGSNAGAMHVSVCGTDGKAQATTRTWQLLATDGDGPYVPTLAAAALVRKLSERKHAANGLPFRGAMPCIGLLSLDDILAEARGLRISSEIGMSLGSLYERVMGVDFERLAAPVQRFHRLSGHHELHDWIETEAPATLAAKVLALCLGTPLKATRGAIRFEVDAKPDCETWTRHFPLKTMASTLSLTGQHVVESLGWARLRFELAAVGDTLEMRLRSLRFLGMPCPAWLLPRIVAQEHSDGQHSDKMFFRVRASLPFIGVVASYRGHLVISAGALQ